MISTEEKNRIKGALIGAFIGDALAVGCHWYYDLNQMREECGEWVDDYSKAKKGHYHEHQNAGDSSQSGYILMLIMESLIANEGYNQENFCETLETKLFPKIDGTAMGGTGGYTSQSIREVYYKRKQGLNWDEVATDVDNTEALERNIAIALVYAFNEDRLATHIYNNTKLTQKDEMLLAQTVAFGAVLSQLIQGKKLDEKLSSKLMVLVKTKKLPFHSVTSDNLSAPKGEEKKRKTSINLSSPDALLTPSYIAQASNDEGIQIDPAWKVSLVYGMPCAIYHILPACYYLGARFKNDFELGVLHALNGGGQNMARAMLTGTLIGAQVGFDNIPQRFIDGLSDKENILDLVDTFCELPFKSMNS